MSGYGGEGTTHIVNGDDGVGWWVDGWMGKDYGSCGVVVLS